MDVRILGRLQVVDSGQTVDLGVRKARLLFGALAIQPGIPVPTDRLAEALWGTALPASWESALYSHISRLRRALEPQRAPNAPSARIETLGDAYVLRLEADELDAARFERLGSEGRVALGRGEPQRASALLEAALAEWRGPVLADLADAPFVARESYRLEALRLVVEEERIEVELALGRHAAAVVELERLVTDHPLRERCWELLLVALYRSGRQAEALRRYQDVRALLVAELGIEPGPGLRQIEAAILDHDDDLRPDRATPNVTASNAAAIVPLPAWLEPADDTFVGRSHELGGLRRAWNDTSGRSRRLVLIAGEPGIGKTRLVREVCSDLVADGAIVLGGRCAEEPMHVLEPFAEALGRLARADPTRFAASEAAVLAGFVPELAKAGNYAIAAESEDQRYLVFRAVSNLLDSEKLGAPVALVLDDVQWASAPTVQLLSHLLHDDDRGPLFVIATHRDTEQSPELDALIGDLRRERRITRVGLVGLGRDDAGVLARARGSEAPIDAIAEMTEGNPFYIEELVRHVAESGGLLDPAAVPETVRDTVALRLLRLTDPTRRLLGIAAVAGMQFDLDVVAAASDLSVDAADDALAVAARTGMVEELTQRVGTYSFSHALIRTVLRDGLGAAREARVHRKLGAAILERHPDRLAEIAHHLLAAAADGSDPLPGLAYARDAARQATARHAYDDAVAVLEAARDRLTDGLDPQLRGAVLIELAHALYITGYRYDELPAILSEIHVIADDLGDAVLQAKVLLESFDMMYEPLIAWTERVDNVLGGLEETSAERVILTAMLARHRSSEPGEHGRELAEWALARSSTLDARSRQVVLEILQRVLDPWSPPERILDLARSCRTAAIASGEQRLLVTALTGERLARLAIGDLDGSDEVGREYESIVDSLQQPRYRAGVAQRRAMRAVLAGRFAEAEVHAEEAIVLQPTEEFLEGYAVQLFAVRFEQGRLREMRPAIEAWAAEYDRPAWHIGYGLLLTEIDEPEAARTMLQPFAAARYRDLPRDDLWFLSLTAAAAAIERLRDAEAAAVLYELLAPHSSRVIVAGQGALCWGSIHRHLAPLASLAGAHERASLHYESAMSMHERLGAQPFLARDRLGYARLLRNMGADPARVETLARTGLAIARELGMHDLVNRNRDLEEA